MNSATCKKCNETKPVQDFYKHQYSRISGLGECKECTKSRVRANRMINLEYYREYDRNRGNRQGIDYLRSYRAKNKAKYIAHVAVNNGIKCGKVEKASSCESCGSLDNLHGHHDDYSKPLEVRWLCAACHRQWHVKYGEAKNAGAAQFEKGQVI